MLSLEPEIVTVRNAGAIADPEAARLIALERRAVFSIYPELRLLLYASVAMITGGVGAYLAKNLQRIGPATIVTVLFAAAAVCYSAVIVRGRRPRREREGRSVLDDYILVLAALLFSAAVGYFEYRYQVLGGNWKHHLLILAIIHGATAYLFDSRALLPVSVAALAGWFGITREGDWTSSDGAGLRVLACAAVVLVWRIANGALRWKPHFGALLEHFAANLALFGTLLLVFDEPFEIVGLILLTSFAAFVVWWGVRNHEFFFVTYGVVYLLVGVDVSVVRRLHEQVAVAAYLLVSTIAAIVMLYWIRRTMVDA